MYNYEGYIRPLLSKCDKIQVNKDGHSLLMSTFNGKGLIFACNKSVLVFELFNMILVIIYTKFSYSFNDILYRFWFMKCMLSM